MTNTDIDICEASGIEFRKIRGQWSWRTVPEGGKRQIVAFAWKTTGCCAWGVPYIDGKPLKWRHLI